LALREEEGPTARFRARTHRLIASRWPTIGVFDVASADDLEAALLLESLTDDRVNETLTRLGRLDRSEWLTGQPGATLVMAAFCHPAPGGGRFNSEALGAWYCAAEIETAIAETVYHHTKRLAHSASGFRHVIQIRELVSEIDAEVSDIRGPAGEAFRYLRPRELRGLPAFWEGAAPSRGEWDRVCERPPAERHQPGRLPPLVAATGHRRGPFRLPMDGRSDAGRVEADRYWRRVDPGVTATNCLPAATQA
jgi:hypothetical protein